MGRWYPGADRYHAAMDAGGLPSLGGLERAVSLAGLGPGAPTAVRARLEWSARLGYRQVQLDAAARDARPRDLSRSARRDLAAALRRLELRASGVDLWIPPRHLVQPETADRALSALADAARFAAEMADLTGGTPVLSTALPAGEARERAVSSVEGAVAASGARLADHAWPPDPAAVESGRSGGVLAVGLDPAAVFLASGDADERGKGGGDGGEGGRWGGPGRSASRLGAALLAARLSDLAPEGRVAPGEGRLDATAYVVSLATAGYGGPLVVDLRGLRDPEAGARRGLDAGSIGPPIA